MSIALLLRQNYASSEHLFPSAQAIPLAVVSKIRPDIFDYRGELLVMTVPGSEGFDSDKFCQLLYAPWWKLFLKLRRTEGLTGKLFTNYEIRIPFTLYPKDQPPVEAFGAEVFLPLLKGWRTKKYGCFTGCQDIRLTREWVLAMYIEEKEHVRAKTRMGFECESGLIAVTEVKPSLREEEPLSAIKAATDPIATRYPRKTKTDRTSLYGDMSGSPSKCVCVKPTGNAEQVLLNTGKRGVDKDGVHGRYYQTQKYGPRHDAEAGTSEPPLKRRVGRPRLYTPRTDELHLEDLDVEVDDLITIDEQIDEMTCYDYDFSDIAMDQTGAVLSPNEANVVSDFVRATLFIAPDFDLWYAAGGDQSGDHAAGARHKCPNA